MRNIIFLGLVSFFADISAEMVYPIIPLYLTTVFGATPALVGIIEGIAESTASLLKVFSGYFTDKYQKKKPIAFIGYAAGLVYKLALLFAGSWGGILAARVIDRIGKGIRTSPRDVMVSESADTGNLGKAFGIHKALDMAGSAIGILLAYFLLVTMSDDSESYDHIFLVSIIPVAAALLMFVFIKEKKSERKPKERGMFWKKMRFLDSRLKLYLVIVFIFTLGNSSNTFLLLRANSVGFSDTSVVLLYFLYHLVASVFAVLFGQLSDKIGRKTLLVTGYLIFSIVYFGFALSVTKGMIIAMFALYGIYTAMTAGVERAFIADIAPQELKGTMLGLHSTLVGIALLPASIIFGILWTQFGAVVPFVFGASLSLIAAIVLMVFLKDGKKVSAD